MRAGPPAGVNIVWDSDNNTGTANEEQFYDWSSFDDLLDNPSLPQYQAVAAFTYSMREFLFEQAGLASEAFTMIEDGFAGFEAGGDGTMLESQCSPGSPVTGTNNKVQITWHDNDVSGRISNEDSFSFVLDNCWFDDPTDDIDTLLNGQIELLHYDRKLQGCPAYTTLRFDETDNAGIIAGSDVTANGGFCIFLPGIGG